jgi:hypothetical protein
MHTTGTHLYIMNDRGDHSMIFRTEYETTVILWKSTDGRRKDSYAEHG